MAIAVQQMMSSLSHSDELRVIILCRRVREPLFAAVCAWARIACDKAVRLRVLTCVSACFNLRDITCFDGFRICCAIITILICPVGTIDACLLLHKIWILESHLGAHRLVQQVVVMGYVLSLGKLQVL